MSERGRYENHIHPILGGMPINKVTKDDARRLSTDLDEKALGGAVHWTTAIKVWGVATKMFRDACASKVAHFRVLEAFPFEGVPGPDRGQRKDKQWLYPDEALRLLACPDVPLRWRRLYALMACLYLRPEELAVLDCDRRRRCPRLRERAPGVRPPDRRDQADKDEATAEGAHSGRARAAARDDDDGGRRDGPARPLRRLEA